MAKDVELISAGMEELLKSDDIYRDFKRRVGNVKQAAGPGMEASVTRGRRRIVAMVWTETPSAMAAEATDRKLTRSIDAGRG